eukprot:TRINITY_DN1051_c0_g1_i2.p1 TRINITY_DN1051_c0_g1~~TRINITY_DN1051_c0_g1_i2.p1  ORF type:complete len:894 (+),score=188.26 TRINITY_DN1051_c0_g1_i2:91-2772(+)
MAMRLLHLTVALFASAIALASAQCGDPELDLCDDFEELDGCDADLDLCDEDSDGDDVKSPPSPPPHSGGVCNFPHLDLCDDLAGGDWGSEEPGHGVCNFPHLDLCDDLPGDDGSKNPLPGGEDGKDDGKESGSDLAGVPISGVYIMQGEDRKTGRLCEIYPVVLAREEGSSSVTSWSFWAPWGPYISGRVVAGSIQFEGSQWDVDTEQGLGFVERQSGCMLAISAWETWKEDMAAAIEKRKPPPSPPPTPPPSPLPSPPPQSGESGGVCNFPHLDLCDDSTGGDWGSEEPGDGHCNFPHLDLCDDSTGGDWGSEEPGDGHCNFPHLDLCDGSDGHDHGHGYGDDHDDDDYGCDADLDLCSYMPVPDDSEDAGKRRMAEMEAAGRALQEKSEPAQCTAFHTFECALQLYMDESAEDALTDPELFIKQSTADFCGVGTKLARCFTSNGCCRAVQNTFKIMNGVCEKKYFVETECKARIAPFDPCGQAVRRCRELAVFEKPTNEEELKQGCRRISDFGACMAKANEVCDEDVCSPVTRQVFVDGARPCALVQLPLSWQCGSTDPMPDVSNVKVPEKIKKKVRKVKFATKLKMDPKKFDKEAFLKSVAKSSGVDAAKVALKVKYVVETAYKFPQGSVITEDSAKTAIAKANGVNESAVTVVIARRLQARQLQSGVSVTATIVSEDADKADAITTSAQDTSSLVSSLEDAGVTVSAPEITQVPETAVDVESVIEDEVTLDDSDSGDGADSPSPPEIIVPDAAALTASFAEELQATTGEVITVEAEVEAPVVEEEVVEEIESIDSALELFEAVEVTTTTTTTTTTTSTTTEYVSPVPLPSPSPPPPPPPTTTSTTTTSTAKSLPEDGKTPDDTTDGALGVASGVMTWVIMALSLGRGAE